MNEADTCRIYLLPKLKTSDWEDDYFTEQMVLTPGRIVAYLDSFPHVEGNSTSAAGVAAAVTVHYGGGVAPAFFAERTLLSSVLRLQGGAFKGEL